MSRLLCAVSLGLFSLVLVVNSGETGDKEKKPVTKIKGMLPPNWKSLKLSPEQVQQVYEIQRIYKTKVLALEDQILETKGQEKAEMFKLLNEEQKTLLRKLSTGEDIKEKSDGEKKKIDAKKDN